jgi:hypothetical protein
MAASRRQRRKRKTDTYTVPEGGKRLKIGRTGNLSAGVRCRAGFRVD